MANTQVKKISVTTSNASVTFSPTVKKVTIKNIGSVTGRFNLNGAATTSHFPIDAGDEITIELDSITTVQAITDSSSTDFRIIGAAEW
jgi:hypothetical protein